MQEFYGMNDGNLAKAAMGFGGGVGGRQSECGAVTGSVMALGFRLSTGVKTERTPESDEARRKMTEATRGFMDGFESKFGATYCRKLTGHDFSEQGGRERYRADSDARSRCFEYVAYAVRTLTGMSL